ncbi:serine/threonine protein kinase [Shewanella sp. NIFS-20-20]|uniref:serine/threonine protein kinase n=1 Tax=Shewanella sp. NIFS-20-20 TaxID=2853806 RepID=UPI001C444076|nr:serine/threonine protein kinase [Shewanella sp. NIFS-20-20]MBV7315659.1 serine/threonine protein kinase [Shewanella sp. NIFS-20-20]
MSAVNDFGFHGLTPDVQLDAIESLGIYPQSGLLTLNSYENRVYQFRCENNHRYVVKFYRPDRWSNQQIQEEHEFAADLQDDELSVVAPLMIHGASLHHFNGYRFALFPSMGGRPFEVDNLDHLEIVGHSLGRLHAISSTRSFSHRRVLEPNAWGQAALQSLRGCQLIPSALKNDYLSTATLLLNDICEQMAGKNYQAIRLHGDLHPGNILWTDNGATLVDLDDACMGPAVQDIWMMLSGERSQQLLQLDVIVEAYNEFSHFNPDELQLIEPLRGLRMLHHNAWLAKRWSDPAFPNHFPWFGEVDFWYQSLQDLNGQRRAMQDAPLRFGPSWS